MNEHHDYKACIDACLACAAACNYCAAACTREEDVNMMADCIRLDMECAAICYAAAWVMSMGSERAKELCKVCADACDACHDECSKHMMDHCRDCANACKACADHCRKMS